MNVPAFLSMLAAITTILVGIATGVYYAVKARKSAKRVLGITGIVVLIILAVVFGLEQTQSPAHGVSSHAATNTSLITSTPSGSPTLSATHTPRIGGSSPIPDPQSTAPRPTPPRSPTPTTSPGAHTLYANNFTTSVAGFAQFFNSCQPTNAGLDCSKGNFQSGGLLYSTALSNIACVSADYTSPTDQYSTLFFTDDTTTWLNNEIALIANYSGHIGVQTADQSAPVLSTVTTPSGKHNYMLCRSGNTFTGYLDGSPIASDTEAGHTPVTFAVQGQPGVPVTNLVVSGFSS